MLQFLRAPLRGPLPDAWQSVLLGRERPAAPLATPGRAAVHARPLSPTGVNRKVVIPGRLGRRGSSLWTACLASSSWRPLDREQQSSYTLRVRATDQSPGRRCPSGHHQHHRPDVNDNLPVFERRDYLVSVPEDTSPGTQVLAVFATSKDIGTNAEITYLILKVWK